MPMLAYGGRDMLIIAIKATFIMMAVVTTADISCRIMAEILTGKRYL
jgi:hypothetical protein